MLYRKTAHALTGSKKLANRTLLTAIAIVLVVVIVGAAAWIDLSSKQPTNTATPTPTPETVVQEQVRDAAMNFIKTNHAETAAFMTNLSWTGGRQDTGLVGSEKYVYNSTDWSVIITYPVIPTPIYAINATYCQGNTAVQWQGTDDNGTITETGYTFTP